MMTKGKLVPKSKSTLAKSLVTESAIQAAPLAAFISMYAIALL